MKENLEANEKVWFYCVMFDYQNGKISKIRFLSVKYRFMREKGNVKINIFVLIRATTGEATFSEI